MARGWSLVSFRPKRGRQLTGEESAPNLPLSRTRNTVSPYVRPQGQGRPQGRLMDMRVWEAGESERRLVMRWTGIEGLNRHHPARKGADFRLVSYRKKIGRTFLWRTGK